jgi:hypothetical protein
MFHDVFDSAAGVIVGTTLVLVSQHLSKRSRGAGRGSLDGAA